MSDKSSIEWTDATWNPIRGTIGRHHCVRVSEGCRACYAATMNHRFNGPDYVKGADTPRLDEAALLWPLRWKGAKEAEAEGRASRIFVCSMTDLFMDEHTDEMIDRVFAVMALAHHHTFQVLTKRSKRMREYMASARGERNAIVLTNMLRRNDPRAEAEREKPAWPLSNVWMGVSAENQERADERIPDLLATPAAVRFVSAEPLLGPIDFEYPKTLYPDGPPMCCPGHECGCMGKPVEPPMWWTQSGVGIDWVIVGGESGSGARPCDVSWVRSIKDQCQNAGVPVFVKQLGARPVEFDPEHEWNDGKDFHKGGRRILLLKNEKGGRDRKGGWMPSWPEDLRVREFPR